MDESPGVKKELPGTPTYSSRSLAFIISPIHRVSSQLSRKSFTAIVRGMARKTPTAPSMSAQNRTEKRMTNGERLSPWLAILGKTRFSAAASMRAMAMMTVIAPAGPKLTRARSVGGIETTTRWI